MLHSDLRKPAYDRGKVVPECTIKTGGFMIGNLYEITYRTKNTSFSCLRHQNIHHKEGDTILVLDVRVSDTKMDWKDVEALVNGKLARFKIWAFMDLIDTTSIKLVK